VFWSPLMLGRAKFKRDAFMKDFFVNAALKLGKTPEERKHRLNRLTLMPMLLAIAIGLASVVYYAETMTVHRGLVVIQNIGSQELRDISFLLVGDGYEVKKHLSSKVPPSKEVTVEIRFADAPETIFIKSLQVGDREFDCLARLNSETMRVVIKVNDNKCWGV